jgi:hypothetical protein
VDTQTILTSDLRQSNKTTVEHTVSTKLPESNEMPKADNCKNGVCSLTWKPQRPAA